LLHKSASSPNNSFLLGTNILLGTSF